MGIKSNLGFQGVKAVLLSLIQPLLAQVLGKTWSISGLSGQTWGNTDWEVMMPIQLQRGERLGSQTTYAAPWI